MDRVLSLRWAVYASVLVAALWMLWPEPVPLADLEESDDGHFFLMLERVGAVVLALSAVTVVATLGEISAMLRRDHLAQQRWQRDRVAGGQRPAE
jgi:O-antigen ligase